MTEPARGPLGLPPTPPGRKTSALVIAYGAFGALVVLLYLASGLLGWNGPAEERTFMPAGARQAPGGYRTYHFWPSGYQGGK